MGLLSYGVMARLGNADLARMIRVPVCRHLAYEGKTPDLTRRIFWSFEIRESVGVLRTNAGQG